MKVLFHKRKLNGQQIKKKMLDHISNQGNAGWIAVCSHFEKSDNTHQKLKM